MKAFKITFSVALSFCFFLLLSQMCNTDSKDLGGGFVYNKERKDIMGKIDIPPVIISFDYDKYFITAKQRPKAFHEAIYDKMEYIYPWGRDTVYYWLIIKQEQKVLGPLDYVSIQKLKKGYNVPDELILK